MKDCTFKKFEEVKEAFNTVLENCNTNILSKEDLTIKLATELKVTPGELKAQYLVAFLSYYMKLFNWNYDSSNECFIKNSDCYIKDKDDNYYNVEEYTYLVGPVVKEKAIPISKTVAKSFVDCNQDLELEELE